MVLQILNTNNELYQSLMSYSTGTVPLLIGETSPSPSPIPPCGSFPTVLQNLGLLTFSLELFPSNIAGKVLSSSCTDKLSQCSLFSVTLSFFFAVLVVFSYVLFLVGLFTGNFFSW